VVGCRPTQRHHGISPRSRCSKIRIRRVASRPACGRWRRCTWSPNSVTSTTGRQARGVRRYGQRRRFESPVHPYEVCDGLGLGQRRRSPSIRDPDLRPARHRSPAATSTRPGYRGQGPGRSSRSTVGGRSVRTQGRLRRRHHRLRRLSARSARLGCPWAHRRPAKGVPWRRYTFSYTSLPTSRARTGTKPLVTVPPLTDSGMPVVHARRRRSGAVGRVARFARRYDPDGFDRLGWCPDAVDRVEAGALNTPTPVAANGVPESAVRAAWCYISG
jgi:hypothetical protein